MKYNILLMIILAAILSFSMFGWVAGCDDDDDDSEDDEIFDEDCDDDEDDDDDADDDDDTSWAGPDCSAFSEGDRWFEIPNMGPMSGKFNDEKDDDGIVTATVSVTGDDFTIEKGTYKLNGEWFRTDAGMPFSDGQTVKVYHTESAGDDGCCDSERLHVWDESFEMLLTYAWNEGMHNLKIGEIQISAESDWENGCEYQEGERPKQGETDWSFVNGLSLTGDYEGSAFQVDLPGNTAFTDDQKFEVNWPVGYRGEVFDNEGQKWPTHFTIFEMITVAVPE